MNDGCRDKGVERAGRVQSRRARWYPVPGPFRNLSSKRRLHSMTIRRVVFAAIVFTFFATELSAATYPAASCSESDVQAAYNTEHASAADGDVISIPAGTCTWTSTLILSP